MSTPSAFPRRFQPISLRLGLLALAALAMGLLWLSNLYLSERFSRESRERAEAQTALYSGRILSELKRVSVVPLLLARDTTLIGDLNSKDFTATSARLISYQNDIGLKSVQLLDDGGRVVGSTDRTELGDVRRDESFVVNALRASDTAFSTTGVEEGQIRFFYSRKMSFQKDTIGVIVVEVDLDDLFKRWSRSDALIFVTNSEGRIILSSDGQYRHLTIEEALTTQPPVTTVERAWRATGDWPSTVGDAYIRGRPLLRHDVRVAHQGWQMTYLAAADAVRARVNGVLAMEVMAIALLTALGFYLASRRAIRQAFSFKRESDALRALNERLSAEIAEREKVERHLQVAEQSLAQSSKLAALGEMSAAVSHELNQPLAAMRTYLAGAKLLLQRKRPDEAAASFQRIDDLIERMGAITKQLKSYARKGSDDLVPLDMRDAVNGALSMMAPQLSQLKVEIDLDQPLEPQMVLADQVRLEQVIVNLFRNALDAMKPQDDRRLTIRFTGQRQVRLTVADNGPGIVDLDTLFEPFYTTKKPGDGIGLGLAISSGIAKDLGGRLIARNGEDTGALFEFSLPRLDSAGMQAAE